MNCVFYDRRLSKKIPCIIIPGDVRSYKEKMITKVYVHTYFDIEKLEEFSVTLPELNRYSCEFVDFFELYPSNTQEQRDYLNSVLPIGTVYNTLELNRFKSLIEMITNTTSLSKDVFYTLSDLISYEIMFKYCSQQELAFLSVFSSTQLDTMPETIYANQMLNMIKNIFSKYEPDDEIYDITNYNDYYFLSSRLPITLNITYMKSNIVFLGL